MPYKFKYGNKEITIPKNTEFTSHAHSWSAITGKPSTFTPSSHNQDWGTITGKPGSFNPANHSHAYATWLGAQYASGGDWMGWYSGYGGSRRGYIQHDGGLFKIVNETGVGETRIYSANYGSSVGFEGTSGNYAGYFLPIPTNKVTLGSTTYRWYCLYQYLSSVNTSDEREKHDIHSMSKQITRSSTNIYEEIFNGLIPKTFYMNDESQNRLHMGFVAQDIVKSFARLNLDEKDFGFIEHEYWIDKETNEEKDSYGLRYEELIALNTHMIQKLYQKVNQQQEQINSLENEIQKLKELILK